MTTRPAGDESPGATEGPLSEMSRLTRWMAHEINNPLGGIQNAFALVRDAVPATHPHFKYVAAIEREIERLASLTRRVHLAYGYDGDPAATVPLATCIADALSALQPLRATRNVAVEIVADQTTRSVPVTGEARRGAIRHLLQHAIEAARPEGKVVVTAWRDGDAIMISAPSPLPVEGEARAAIAGPAGLALQMVRRLVDVAGGEVSILSDEGNVRTVRISLPIP